MTIPHPQVLDEVVWAGCVGSLLLVFTKLWVRWLKSFPPRWQWLYGAWLPEDELTFWMKFAGVALVLAAVVLLVGSFVP